MKKIIILIICFFAAAAISFYYFSSLNSVKKTSMDPAKNEAVFYSILGRSNKLSQKQVENMEKWRVDVVNIAKKNPDEVYINGSPDSKMVALTFDDGPDSIIMPQILEILKQHGVNGSFFLIGENVQKNASVVKKAYNEGNLVLSHSFSHPDLTTLTAEGIKNQLTNSESAIFKVVGKKPAIFRPPYGAVNDQVIESAKLNGDKIIIWSIDTLDWSQKEKTNIIKNVINNVRSGEIILMHCNEDKAMTAAALPEIIDTLKAEGYNIVTLDKLLNIPAYK